MKGSHLICGLFIFIFLSTSLLHSESALSTYDVIVVRADLPIDYVVAQAYAHKVGIPIVATDPLYLDDIVRRELQGYRSEGASAVLIIGGSDTAISTGIEQELKRMGYQTHRLWDWDRIGTAARVAIELWDSSHYAVIAHADVSESYLIASSISINLQAPILLTTEENLPDTTIQALEALRVKEVFLVGPKISPAVEEQISTLGIEIQRVGKDIEVKNITLLGQEDTLLSKLKQPLPLVVGGLMGLCLGYLLAKVFKKVKKREIPMFVLTEDERKVVEAIGDGLKQERLPELTNFSRPKITRIISDLEDKQIITRIKYGKTYRIKVMKSIVED